ncbi:MAG: GTPase Era [Sulfurovum sp.]|nr:MAG: GTPase Era [Sulfurovum sp.]
MINQEKTKAGYIAVVGRPNAGKSTLLNYLVGEKLAMVSHKAQATRKRMNIIVMYENAQLIFVDTPGIHHQEKLINQFMLEEALKAMGDSDLILFLMPVTDKLDEYKQFLELESTKERKHIVLLTKVDTVSNDKVLKKLMELNEFSDKFSSVIPWSIKHKSKKDILFSEISKYLPESPFLYETEYTTTNHIRDIYKEFIREALFDAFSDEIPYESDVVITKIFEEDTLDKVYATIIVEKETQKGIIVGKKGDDIKRLSILARKKLELFSQKKIYLELHISVKKGWSKSRETLEEIGYLF